MNPAVAIDNTGVVHRAELDERQRRATACSHYRGPMRPVTPAQILVYHLTRCERCWPVGWPGHWGLHSTLGRRAA